MESSLGFSVDSVRHAVQNNKHNHLSATYYLLLKKYAQINYKQSQRNYSVQSRHQGSSHSNHLNIEERKSTVTNSDTKKQTNNSIISEHENSFSQTQNNTKYNKLRNKKGNEIENDRLKAPVKDQLVLKNHRREQSANATAGRTNRNGDWGDVQDERRVESYERPTMADDYEIVTSKVN